MSDKEQTGSWLQPCDSLSLVSDIWHGIMRRNDTVQGKFMKEDQTIFHCLFCTYPD